MFSHKTQINPFWHCLLRRCVARLFLRFSPHWAGVVHIRHGVVFCLLALGGGFSTVATAQYHGSSLSKPPTQVKTARSEFELRAPRFNADSAYAAAQVINFSGFRWRLRKTDTQAEPGNLFFSDARSEIWTDAEDKLHLNINLRDGYWRAVELVADTVLGYGSYIIFAEINLDTLRQNVTLEFGLTPEKYVHQFIPADIAVQFTRGGALNSANPLQYLVAGAAKPNPANGGAPLPVSARAERVFRPDTPFRMKGTYSTHAFTWRASGVEFASYHDHGFPTPYLGALWEFTGSPALNLAVPSDATPYRMRLRLWSSGAPLGSRPFEIVIKKIQFVPLRR